MAQRNEEQYRVVKGQKAKKAGFEVGYEYTTGNETGKQKKKE
ncbi:hypothetical protein ACFSCX_19690 [Bacillus salitolerans]|uniref:YfhE family protein n=1 Tax=Bacillus salitolerans TaxID=1437434 RepID=A0ABW4LVW9_9BACI